MSRVLLALLLLILLQPSPTSTLAIQESAPAKKYYIAIFSRGSAWDAAKPANEQIGFKEHSENLRRMRTEKRIPVGGRYGEKGMVLLQAANEEEARAQFASDLMVTKKTFDLELQEFRPFYKGTVD